MLKKIKKYFLLIPLLMVLCFNVCVYGSVKAVDYSAYFHNLDDLNLPSDYLDSISPGLLGTGHFPLSIINGSHNRNYFFVVVYMNQTNYDYFKNDSNYDVSLLVYDFNDDNIVPIYENDSFIRYHGFKDIRRWIFSYDVSTAKYDIDVVDLNPYDYDLVYFKESGQFNAISKDIQNSSISTPHLHIFYVDTTVPNFPLFDYNFDSSLDVQVRFSPDLTGSVDRSFTDSEGSTYLRSDLSMRVNNFSKFPIQYMMDIRPVDSNTDFVFRYYKNDWVYAPNIDSAGNYWNQIPQKQQKATNCHYVGSGQVDVVNFNFNQINLVEGIEYVVEVYAARNDYGIASELVVSSVEDVYPELYQVQYTLVHESVFSMKQYSDVKYDPTNNSNGVLPYDFELGQKYEHSYNAVEKEDGEIDYTGKDVYSDKDSWYHKPIDDNTQGGSFSSSTSSSNGFSNFAKSFQNFFGFIRYMFNFLPKDAKTLFTIGFTGITIIALVKVLFKS